MRKLHIFISKQKVSILNVISFIKKLTYKYMLVFEYKKKK